MTEAASWISRGEEQPADDAGAVLRAWRAANSLNQGEVAATLGITQQGLSHFENGRRAMSYELRQLAVQALGIPAADLGLADGRPRSLSEAQGARRWRPTRRVGGWSAAG